MPRHTKAKRRTHCGVAPRGGYPDRWRKFAVANHATYRKTSYFPRTRRDKAPTRGQASHRQSYGAMRRWARIPRPAPHSKSGVHNVCLRRGVSISFLGNFYCRIVIPRPPNHSRSRTRYVSKPLDLAQACKLKIFFL